VKQTAATVMRLSDDVVTVIGEIINSEHPELVLRPREEYDSDRSELLHSVDCRVYRKFVNITSLKSATVFMKAEGELGVQAQINALYRVRDLCRENGYKAAPFRTVAQQFQKARAALMEAKKFETLLESSTWPEEMEAVRLNLLRTTKFDDDVEANTGNDTDILPSVLESYRRACSSIAPQKEAKYRASFTADAQVTVATDSLPIEGNLPNCDDENQPSPSTPAIGLGTSRPAALSSTGDEVGTPKDFSGVETHPEETACGTVEKNRRDAPPKNVSAATTEASERLQIAGIDALNELGIVAYQMKWQVFYKTVREEGDAQYDLILTDPPYGTPKSRSKAGIGYDNFVDSEDMKQAAECARKLLRPGGWVFLFTSVRYFMQWHEAFRACGFRAPEYPFVIVKNTEGLQEVRGNEFPQNASEFAYVGRAPGQRTDEFKPDLRSPYHVVESTEKRKF